MLFIVKVMYRINTVNNSKTVKIIVRGYIFEITKRRKPVSVDTLTTLLTCLIFCVPLENVARSESLFPLVKDT